MCPEAIEQLAIEEADQIPTQQTIATLHGVGPPTNTFNIQGLLITALAGDTTISLENAHVNEIP